MTEAVRERMQDLPPSAVIVYRIVEDREPVTHKEILEAEPYAPDRTLRYGLRQLREAGLVEREHSLQDVRQHQYTTTDG
jgi:DNA-binding HxlR family transcriptional regulator